MNPDTIQNTHEARDHQRLDQKQPREPFVLDGGGARPTVCARVFGTMPVAAIHGSGSPVTPRRNSAIAVVRIGGIQPSRLARSPSFAPRSSMKAGSAMRGIADVPNDAAKLLDHAAERDRLRLHQIPRHARRRRCQPMSRPASQAMVAAMSSTATG